MVEPGGYPLSCSFCGKTQKQVGKSIAGPDVYICDGCISLCVEVIAGELGDAPDGEMTAIARRVHDDLEELRRLAFERGDW